MTSPPLFPISNPLNSIAPGKMLQIVQSVKPEISIRLDSRKSVFTTLDRIKGDVRISAPADTDFDSIDIEFVGTSTTYVQRLTAIAATSGRLEAFHNFLRLSQPGLNRLLPTDRILRAGKIYTFPFVFVIPQQLLPHVCKHSVANDLVRNAHYKLLPTFGDRELSSRDGGLDDMVPEMASVRYGILATIRKLIHNGDNYTRRIIANKVRRLRVVPIAEEEPPLDMDWRTQQQHRSEYIMRRERKVKKGLLKGKLGTLVMEAEQPKALHLASGGNGEERVTSQATIMLRFEPEPGVSQTPRLDRLISKLKVRTYFATVARTDIPRKADSEYDASKGQHGETLELASRCVSDVKWQLEIPTNKTRQEVSHGFREISADVPWVPEPSTNYTAGAPVWVSKLVVPIELPSTKNFVPTFHSCLISRTYTLSLSITLQKSALGGAMDLRIPIQISASPAQKPAVVPGLDERSRSSVLSNLLETDVEDDPTDFFAPRNTVSLSTPSRNRRNQTLLPVLIGMAEDSPPEFQDMPTFQTTVRVDDNAGEAPPDYAGLDSSSGLNGSVAVESGMRVYPAVR